MRHNDEVFIKSEINILQILLMHNKTGKLNALRVNKLVEILASTKNYKQSISTVRRCIKKLVGCGFVAEGIRVGKYKTYYITQKGAEFMNELINEIKGDNDYE